MTEFYLVDVSSIRSSISDAEFDKGKIERLGGLILEADGLLQPLILKQTGIENYEVVAGHFEYYAALRAKQKNPRQAGTVNAWVIKSETEQTALQQIAFLKQSSQTSDKSDTLAYNLEELFKNQLQNMTGRLEEELQKINKKIPTQTKPVDAFNTLGKEDLIRRLYAVGIKGKQLEKIVAQIIQGRHFKDISDVVKRVKGLSETRMIAIIDAWSDVLFI